MDNKKIVLLVFLLFLLGGGGFFLLKSTRPRPRYVVDSVGNVELRELVSQGQRTWASLSTNERHALGFRSWRIPTPNGIGAPGRNLPAPGSLIWFRNDEEFDRWRNGRGIGFFTTVNTHYYRMFGRRIHAPLV